MPSLVLCGVRLPVAGDDLRLHSLGSLLFRTLQLAVLVPVLILFLQLKKMDGKIYDQDTSSTPPTNDVECLAPGLLKSSQAYIVTFLYWSMALAECLVSMLLECFIWRVSLRGSPSEPEKRDGLKFLCFLRLVPVTIFRCMTFATGILSAMVLKKVCLCVGSVNGVESYGGDDHRCRNVDPLVRTLAVLVATHGIQVAVALLIGAYFVGSWLTSCRNRKLIAGLCHSKFCWAVCCRCCCSCTSVLSCCLLGGREAVTADFADISVALVDFLDDGGHLDVTLSDITAGMVMLYREQKDRREACRIKVIQQESNITNSQSPLDTMEAGQRDGSERSGQWAPEPSLSASDAEDMQLQRKSIVGYSPRHENGLMFFEAHERMLLSARVDHDRQVIAEGAHFMKIARAVYGWLMYAIDHKITGPFNLLTHAVTCRRSCCDPTVKGDNLCGLHEIGLLHELGLEPGSLAYASFEVSLAKTPYCILVDKPWKTIVLVVRGTMSLEEAVTDLSFRPSSLVDLGQKHGFDGMEAFCHAGVLRSAEWVMKDMVQHGVLQKVAEAHPDYEVVVTGHSLGAGVAAILSLFLRAKYKLRCLCFSPPGCVLSRKLANQEFITSYVLGSDLVPRLSLKSMHHLRDELLVMIARIKVPKHRIMRRYRDSVTHKELLDLLREHDDLPDCEFVRKLTKFREHQQSKLSKEYADLCIPGKVVHLVKTNRSSESSLRRLLRQPNKYSAVWASLDDMAEIQMSTNMMADHFPYTVLVELEKLAALYDIQPPYNDYERKDHQ